MCAWSMFKPFQEAHQQNRTTNYTLVDKDFKTPRGFLVDTVWRMLYANNPEAVHVKANGADNEDFSLEFSHAAGIVIWMSYQIIMSVLMLNILIAIMNTTYSKVWQSAESKWKFERTRYLVGLTESHFRKLSISESMCFFPQAEFTPPRASFPSPFRFLYYLAKAAYLWKQKKCAWLCPTNSDLGNNRQGKVKYFQLLNELIQRRKNMMDAIGVENGGRVRT